MAWYWIVLIVSAYLTIWTLMAAWAYSESDEDEDEELFVGILIVSMFWPIVLVIAFIGDIVRKITKKK